MPVAATAARRLVVAGGSTTAAAARAPSDLALITGTARFVDDLQPTDLATMAVARSTVAHARLKEVDLSAAQCLPGVLLVLTGQDTYAALRPIPPFIDPGLLGGARADVHALPRRTVRYVGQPIAVVVAEDPHTAAHAASLITAEYELLPAVMDGRAALDPAASVLYADQGWTDNVIYRTRTDTGGVEEAFAAADHCLTRTFAIPRATTAPLEPRGYLASWDAVAGRLTLHASCQNPHQLRWMIATTLGLAESAVRVVVPHVGGAFGLKMHGHPEEPLVCLCSRLLGRPVKWIESRRECFLIGGREQVHDVEVAFDGDGVLRALRDRIVVPVGAVSSTPGWAMGKLSANTLPSGYRLRTMDVQLEVVTTTTPPWNASRGYGKEAAILVMERLLDLVARRVGIDPIEARRRNVLRSDELPHRTPSGFIIDSGDYPRLLDQLEARRRPPATGTAAQSDEVLRATGIAFEVTPEAGGIRGTFVGDYETATVRMDATARVQVLSGLTNPGGGNPLGLARIVAAELGLAPEDVLVVQGDTDLCPYGFGNFSGRGTIIGGSAAALAARGVAAQLREAAAAVLRCAADTVVLHERQATHPEAGAIALADLCLRLYTRTVEAADGTTVEPPLEATSTYRPGQTRPLDDDGHGHSYPAFSSAAYLVEVAVDRITGTVTVERVAAVHDCGTVIDEALVDGQVHGAVTMGLGAALSEQVRFDAAGVLLSDSFKSYVVLRAPDLPSFEVAHQCTPSPNTLLGAKGAGEAGVGGAIAALVNAVDAALAQIGATVTRLPVTPPNVLASLVDAGRA